MTVSVRTAPYEWIWEHWSDLTPAQKQAVRRRIGRETAAVGRAFVAAVAEAERSLRAFGEAVQRSYDEAHR